MLSINYLTEDDKIKMKKTLWPIVEKMSSRELRVALFYILYGVDIYEAIESAKVIENPFV